MEQVEVCERKNFEEIDKQKKIVEERDLQISKLKNELQQHSDSYAKLAEANKRLSSALAKILAIGKSLEGDEGKQPEFGIGESAQSEDLRSLGSYFFVADS
jgi:hypothetical protein